MTELMHFQPGKALYDAYQQGRGNYLAGQAFNSQGDQRQSALGQLAGLNPDKAMALKADFDEQDKADFTEFSNVILNAPEDLKPQIYAKGVQRFGYKIRALGVEPPTDYRQALPLFEQLAKATGGKGKYTGAPIIVRGEDGKDYYARYSDNGIEQTNFRPSDSYTYDTDSAGNVWRGAKRSGEYGPAPLEVGKQPSASPESTTNTIATNLQQILRDAGFDEASARDVADAYHSRVGSKPKGQYTDGVVADMPSPAAGQVSAGGQARVAVKTEAPKEPKTAVAYDKDGNMIIVDASKPGIVPGAVRPGSQLSGAQIAKRQDAARKEKAALDAANQQTDDTVRIIDDLTSSGLEGTVGTFGFLSNIPGTDWADKKAKITTLTARAAFGALQEMRQNSPTGGALGGIAVQELLLLQNAQTQLERAQSPEAFKAALVEFKKALLQTKTRVNRAYAEHYGQSGQSAPQAPQNNDDALINKYLD